MDLLRIHKALADETRLRLVAVLNAFELNVGELVGVFSMGQPRISRHLKIMAEAGLLECRRDGLWAFYRAAQDGPGREFLERHATLLERIPQYVQDRERALFALRERVQATRRFFDAVAGQWRDLSREVLGDFDGLPFVVRQSLAHVMAKTAGCRAMTLNLALNYSGREEILRASRALARKCADGVLAPQEIDEAAFASELYTAGQPDPDLIIRTSGELRLSNYLLFQAAYAEFYFTDTLWPDFDAVELESALAHYQSRQRRFGKTGEQVAE